MRYITLFRSWWSTCFKFQSLWQDQERISFSISHGWLLKRSYPTQAGLAEFYNQLKKITSLADRKFFPLNACIVRTVVEVSYVGEIVLSAPPVHKNWTPNLLYLCDSQGKKRKTKERKETHDHSSLVPFILYHTIIYGSSQVCSEKILVKKSYLSWLTKNIIHILSHDL